MEPFSALLAICAGNSPVPGEFPAQRPVTRSFDVFFDLRLNKPLSKQSWGWWFETLPRPLWRHSNGCIRIFFAVTVAHGWFTWFIFLNFSGCSCFTGHRKKHYNDVIMGAIASQITSLTIVFSNGYSDADQRKHQSSASLAFVRRIHRWPMNSPQEWPVTRKMFPFDDVIMRITIVAQSPHMTM